MDKGWIGPQKLTSKILIAMAAGLIVGVLLNLFQVTGETTIGAILIDGLFDVGGKIFVASLKLLVVPLVFVSLVCGASTLDDIRKLGRIGGKTVILYMLTTAVAITVAILVSNVVNPGIGFELTSAVTYSAPAAPSIKETLLDIFPTNPIKSMAEGNMLQLIVFSLLFGLAISLTGRDSKAKLVSTFNTLNDVIMKLVLVLMSVAPIGVFCLLAKVFAEQGFGAIAPLAKYFFVVVFCLLIQLFFVYPALLKSLSGLSPMVCMRKLKELMIFAFSTSSSNATMPVTLETVEDKLGVHNSVASFTIPLGATINMDGTSIMQGVATVFIAQAYGIDISMTGYLMVILTATLASVGTAGVPGVGLITLAMVLNQVGLPVEGIGLIIGVDRLLDMSRTAVNIVGDCVVTCVVAKQEGHLDEAVYNS
jgi:Na+/H+-dicarboxylate symporter